jgi:hypothetical protein
MSTLIGTGCLRVDFTRLAVIPEIIEIAVHGKPPVAGPILVQGCFESCWSRIHRMPIHHTINQFLTAFRIGAIYAAIRWTFCAVAGIAIGETRFIDGAMGLPI